MTFGNAIKNNPNHTRTYSPLISEQSNESNKDKSDTNLHIRRKSANFFKSYYRAKTKKKARPSRPMGTILCKGKISPPSPPTKVGGWRVK